ncbi:hypothetical protein NBRGN_109_00050 [Nocardia brasiliensis NBRC 14402]|nr:hypothetical protein NBRGN_109_00050 [Nocardia brasiliensis NBRC 14402]
MTRTFSIKAKRAALITFTFFTLSLGISTGVGHAGYVPYGYYPTSLECNNAGLAFIEGGPHEFNGYHCYLERNGLYHLYMDERD